MSVSPAAPSPRASLARLPSNAKVTPFDEPALEAGDVGVKQGAGEWYATLDHKHVGGHPMRAREDARGQRRR